MRAFYLDFVANNSPNTVLNRPSLLDELVKVLNNWNVKRGRTRLHPVFTQLVAVLGVDWSNGIA